MGQGADIVAERTGVSVVVQCKKYSKTVGNAAVQEVIAAKSYWKSTHAAVVSNAPYTQSALALANSAGVALLHHDDLPSIHKFFK